MKFATALAASTATVVSALPQYAAEPPSNPHEWMTAGPNDFRGPCPMLNTLTNHGFFPRDGRNFTKENTVKGLVDGLNFDPKFGELMWEQAIIANPEPNATFFTLDQLNVHGVLEHDASLTRTDALFGNNHIFNETVYNSSRQWWTEEMVTLQMLANSKLFRQIESRSQNPNYTFTSDVEEFSLGEVSAPIVAFGSFETRTVNRTLMEYFFENERLPYELGWTKKEKEVTLQNILTMTSALRNATSLLTPGETTDANPHGSNSSDSSKRSLKRDFHGGIFA